MSESAHRAGYVAIAGRPNVGKSTLLNRLVGHKVSITSRKPQTTRHKILGILEGEGFQLCLLDTPGLLDRPKDGLQKSLGRASRSAAQDDADVVVALHLPRQNFQHALEITRYFASFDHVNEKGAEYIFIRPQSFGECLAANNIIPYRR